MRKLTAFNFITLNGFLSGPDGDISWHRHGAEENEYAAEALQSDSILLFGRKTYEMMSSYWPTPMAKENDPVVASGMNKAEKIVFSRTLKSVSWENTKIIGKNVVEEVRQLKASPGSDMTLLGSGSILSLFADNDLIDSFQIMIDPVVLNEGISIFHKSKANFNLKLVDTKIFKSGVVLLSYEPN